jgi:hypothetical protein
MAKIQKNIRIEKEVNDMLDKIISVHEDVLSIKLSQAAMIEYLIKMEYKNLFSDVKEQ